MRTHNRHDSALTPSEQKILDVIAHSRGGVTLWEITMRTGICRNTARACLRVLRESGLVRSHRPRRFDARHVHTLVPLEELGRDATADRLPTDPTPEEIAARAAEIRAAAAERSPRRTGNDPEHTAWMPRVCRVLIPSRRAAGGWA